MKIRVIIAGTCMAIAAGSISVPSMAAPVTIETGGARTTESRIENMMKRMDRFQDRIRHNDDSKLYVSRDGQRVADAQNSGSYRLNR